MKDINLNVLSNSEIKIKLIELENEYKSTQNKIRDLLFYLNDLDKKYINAKKILEKRTKGRYN